MALNLKLIDCLVDHLSDDFLKETEFIKMSSQQLFSITAKKVITIASDVTKFTTSQKRKRYNYHI